MATMVRNLENDKTLLLHKDTIKIIKSKILLGLKKFTIEIPFDIHKDWRNEQTVNLAKLGVKQVGFSQDNEKRKLILHIVME